MNEVIFLIVVSLCLLITLIFKVVSEFSDNTNKYKLLSHRINYIAELSDKEYRRYIDNVFDFELEELERKLK